MQQQNASFWADIKYLEERLAQNPDSYLFARLAEIYLKVNLVDDALHTARNGVRKYPAFIAGQRALAMACQARGLDDERRHALEAITSALPDDIEAQKALAGLLVASGDREAAIRTYGVALEFHPEDAECLEELKVLERSAQIYVAEAPQVESAEPAAPTALRFGEESPAELEEIIDLTEDDILVEEIEAPVAEVSFAEIPVSEAPVEETLVEEAPAQHDPLSTATLAELYVKQGFIPKALEIYRALRDSDPSNLQILSRVAELEAWEPAPAVVEAAFPESSPAPDISRHTSPALPSGLPSHGRADEVISTLEGWLDNIRRIKACR